MAVRSKNSACVLLAAFGVLGVGCGGSSDQPQTPAGANTATSPYGQPPAGQYGQQPYGQPSAAPSGYGAQPQYGQPAAAPTGYGAQPSYGAPTGAPSASGAPTMPGMPAMGTSSGPSATPLDPSAGVAATAILTQLAAGSIVSGAKPLGSPIVGNFQTGQSLEGQLQLSPGKCYTIVGAGIPPVSELNLQLVAVTPIPNMAPVLAQDSDSGFQAVVGKKPNCYKWPLPVGVPVKVVMTVAGGSGLAAAQVYEK